MSKKENMYAYHIIDDEPVGRGGHEESPYDTDHRGAGEKLPQIGAVKYIKSVGNKFSCFKKRELNEETTGVLTFECTYQIISGDGFYFGFYGDKGDEKEAVVLKQCADMLYAGEVAVAKADNAWHYVKLVMNIDKGTFKIHVDGKFVKELAFTGKAKSISRFIMGYEAGEVGEANLGGEFELYKNYLFCDAIVPKYTGTLPEEYVVTKQGKVRLGMRRYSETSRYSVYYAATGSNSSVQLARSFARASGNVCLEFKYLIPKAGAKLTASLTNNTEKVVTVFDELTALCTKDGILRKHSKNVWQTLRIEADTDTNTAKVRLNGKVCSIIAFENAADFIDGMLIEFDAQKAVELQLADFRCMVIPPYPADYVPEPVIPKKKGDYYIGMNICSLWREGTHYGWDCITPFPENKPLLGYYDEGVTETADWELKWMAEHGLDFQLYCWYGSEAKKPMLKTMLSAEIHDGHMLAKYSDKVKMALLWEIAASKPVSCFEELRDYIFPYFIDYFFTDPRYMHIDGKAIMSIYAPERLAQQLGGPANVKKSLDYLRNEVKKLGYKDLIIMCCGENSPFFKECGVDAVHAYSWDINGWDVEFTKSRILGNMREGSVHTVPTISMGFNHTGWTGLRTPVLEPSDMVTLLEWARDEIISQYDKDSWKSKLIMLSTWNEYGEGTYMMPAGVHGFGYLDALRKVFCEDVPHTDVAPNQDQQARICNLYPRDRRLLAAYDNLPEDTTERRVLKKYEFKTKEDLAKWEIFNLTSYELRDGKMCGHSEQNNPYMILHDDEFFPISTEKIGKIVAMCRTYKPVDAACCIQHGYLFEPDKWFPQMPACVSDPSAVVPLVIEPSKIPGFPWHETLYGFRFDPVWKEGDFELESITFYEAPPHKLLKIDGNIVDLKHDVFVEDGLTYIPFDPRSALSRINNLYFEWDPQAEMLSLFGEKTAIFVKDCDVVRIDGVDVKLAKPLTFFDGLPCIEAKLFADIIGRKIVEAEYEIKFDI